MNKTLLVENLHSSVTAADLKELFEKFGTLSAVVVATDHATGMSQGIAFVDFEDGAESAMGALNGSAFHGRSLVVSESSRSAEDVMRAQAEQWGEDPESD
jgi:RNA recognition motif-containing protein